MINIKITRKLISHAFPIISSSLGLLLMGVTDTIVISLLGESALAAQSLASFIHMAVFMSLVAFVFPVANLYKLNQHDAMPILKSGLVLTVGLILPLTAVYLFGIPDFIVYFLNSEQQDLFNAYFKTIAMSLLPGALFFYCRMLLYTQVKPKQIGHWIVICIILNAGLDYLILHVFESPGVVVQGIALITVLVFCILVLLTNHSLPEDKKLQKIINVKSNKQSYYAVLKTSGPAGITALGEYGFFAVLAVMVALYAPLEAASYRIILQLEEMLIIIFYAFARVLSLEVSQEDGGYKTLKSSYYHATALLLLVVFLLPIFHPFVLKVYGINISFSQHYFIIIMLLLFAEALMLYICAFLWGFARYTIVAIITCTVNWGIILPMLWLWPPAQIETFYYALIANYALIAVLLLIFCRTCNITKYNL